MEVAVDQAKERNAVVEQETLACSYNYQQEDTKKEEDPVKAVWRVVSEERWLVAVKMMSQKVEVSVMNDRTISDTQE